MVEQQCEAGQAEGGGGRVGEPCAPSWSTTRPGTRRAHEQELAKLHERHRQDISDTKKKQWVIDEITRAIKSTPGVSLLGVDPGSSTNRTVYTFVGSPDAVIQGALNAARVAYKRIDMTKHKGEHARLGALDVCPFIPVQGVEMEECVYCARKFGEKLSAELNVPVYLYGFAAQHDYRRSVPQIRSGEYEGLCEKIGQAEWRPDYGPAEFVPQWGATMSGARKFLIAYNINVLATKEQAHRIALDIREEGRGKGQVRG
ncbi:hypothetical protein HPB48_026689 [Haemaphysalis longicornis]|uniref:glutamate formimidoyltransferase n=1 Tax=Haemaphysalis longicornis TaxID=44386 RepID=A0A9J6HA47_HAELO|nr:hypothetical protein HPB48_026689 [Haemaphysalis longicornis]